MKTPDQTNLAIENLKITLPENITFKSERLNFAAAWKIEAEDLRLAADNFEIAVAVGEDFPNEYKLSDAEWFLDKCKKDWESGTEYSFAMRDKNSGKFIGNIGFKVNGDKVTNIGYWLGKDFQGQGFATEALNNTVNFIKQNFPNVKEIHAGAYKYNTGSQNVLTKAGFLNVGLVTKGANNLRNGESNEGYNYIFKLVNE